MGFVQLSVSFYSRPNLSAFFLFLPSNFKQPSNVHPLDLYFFTSLPPYLIPFLLPNSRSILRYTLSINPFT
jgi:hypothetical protein